LLEGLTGLVRMVRDPGRLRRSGPGRSGRGRSAARRRGWRPAGPRGM